MPKTDLAARFMSSPLVASHSGNVPGAVCDMFGPLQTGIMMMMMMLIAHGVVERAL